MSNEMPETPLTDLAASAVQLHEMYTAYMDAGFPEHRAFELVTTVLMTFLDA
jgi:hypothetical protein